jgi:hypothetical protein
MNHVAHAGFVVQPAGNLTAVLAFHRNAIAFAVGLAGQGILADLLMRKPSGFSHTPRYWPG